MATELTHEQDGPLYAGLGRRLGAHLLDAALCISIFVLAGVILRILRVSGVWNPAGPGGRLDPVESWRALGWLAKSSIIFAVFLCMGPTYFALFESSPWRATLGKRALGIQVSGDDGARIGILRSLGRWFARTIFSWFGLSLISIITITAVKKEKALHDYVARTVVLRGRPEPSGLLGSWRALLGLGVPLIWTVAVFLLTMPGGG